MNDIAVHVERLSKEYRIGGRREKYRTLRDSFTDIVSAPFRRAYSLLRGQAYGAAGLEETIWALKDVSFDVGHGEVIGIIGRNGAGKSTLLKILSRITEPTEGHADTGFHFELTGRENIYLNGAILGMSREEINRKFDEIVAFAEVEHFIDTPVKHYSSGMGLRLGFSVAAHLEPEILVIDEVLAVGDAEFQKKCLGKMSDVAGEGRTVLFVSHNMGAVESLCDRAIWLEKGIVRADGPSSQVVSDYLSSTASGNFIGRGRNGFEVTSVTLNDNTGRATSTFLTGKDIEVRIHYKASRRIIKPFFWLVIQGRYGPVFGANMLLDGQNPEAIEGEGTISCRFSSVPLLPQTYTVRMGVRSHGGKGDDLFERQEVAVFHTTGDLAQVGLQGENANSLAERAVSYIHPYEWIYADGTVTKVCINAVDNREEAGSGAK
jgi:lipopolysaccharide transport system ATP-binding protein